MFTEQVRHLKQPVLRDITNLIPDKQVVSLHLRVTSWHILPQLHKQQQGLAIMSMEQGRHLRLNVQLEPINHLQPRLPVLQQVQDIMFLWQVKPIRQSVMEEPTNQTQARENA